MNKVKRLLVPYAFASIIWVAPMQQLFFHYDGIAMVKNFLFAANPNQLWFLVMLFNVFVIAWIISDFMARHTWLSLMLVICLYLAASVGAGCIPNAFQVWNGLSYLPFFWIGFKIRQNFLLRNKLFRCPAYLWIGLHIMLFVLRSQLAFESGAAGKVMKYAVELVMCIVGSVAAYVVLQKLAQRVCWKKCKFFRVLSEHSFSIYLFHQQIIYFGIVWFNGVINPYMHAMVNCAMAIGGSLVISIVLTKCKYTRRLIGAD